MILHPLRGGSPVRSAILARPAYHLGAEAFYDATGTAPLSVGSGRYTRVQTAANSNAAHSLVATLPAPALMSVPSESDTYIIANAVSLATLYWSASGATVLPTDQPRIRLVTPALGVIGDQQANHGTLGAYNTSHELSELLDPVVPMSPGDPVLIEVMMPHGGAGPGDFTFLGVRVVTRLVTAHRDTPTDWRIFNY